MLRVIEPKDLHFEWDRVREGLEVIRQKTPDEWIAEDVYMAIRQGQAALYVAEDDHGDYLGFIVLRLTQGYRATKLDIWCAHSAVKVPLMRRVFPELQDLARKAGARKIGFASARPEWAANRLGFKPVQTSYELEI